MQTQIQKWGNSLGLRIPMHLAKKLKLHQGSMVIIEIKDDLLVIKAHKYNLEDMVKAITPTNRHHEIFNDEPVGNEEW